MRRQHFITRGWLMLAVMGAMLALLLLARGQTSTAPTTANTTAPAGGAVTFMPVDVWVDSGKKPLGAYQLEIVAQGAVIVGLEGGESKAFGEAPYYDPAALQGNRIVVAAFSTDDDLPTGLTRVARLHMMVEGEIKAGGLPPMTDKLVVATDGQGQTVNATLTLRPQQGAIR